jgi:hypothetical protein
MVDNPDFAMLAPFPEKVTAMSSAPFSGHRCKRLNKSVVSHLCPA